ncbi:sugar transferase [Solibacillus silvestris]|uniref:sugar transferase n=1 Tax=Solibacillus silvestris TaxID=76853 RepID=UPI003F7D863A
MISPASSENPSVKRKQSLTNLHVQINNNKCYLISKRIIDFALALLGLIFLSPLFMLIAITIKAEDYKGPVLYKQIRIGKDSKEFYIYKFRSMVPNAECLKATLSDQNEASGPVFKMKRDPRVTKVGRFIRKTSLDELPQLINVVKGEMSLVGPRPPLPEEVAQYTNYEFQRLSVTPGLTCYWQVSGRSNIEFSEWMQLDMKYISKRSIWVDMKLILKTIVVLFGSRGAY